MYLYLKSQILIYQMCFYLLCSLQNDEKELSLWMDFAYMLQINFLW
jgi:hypothetical protein